LTRTRGYELFANVALANQGQKGGTLAWTPKSGNDRELFRTRGTGHGIATTVALPLRDLDAAQRSGIELAIQDQVMFWNKPSRKRAERGPFKAPPPGFGGK